MTGKSIDGNAWIEEQRRLRSKDPVVGRWAHTFLWRAADLHERGFLSMKVRRPEKWQRQVLAAGLRWAPLEGRHHAWLVEQARTLKKLSTIEDDPIGQCAKHLMDWLIWFWTADACHPITRAVRRDGIKHDYRRLSWTQEAREEIDRAIRGNTRVSTVVEHEHVVPKRVLIDLILSGRVEAGVALHSFARAALVSKREHGVLNDHFRERMPPGWDPLAAKADPYARYKHPSVSIRLNAPEGTA